MSIVNKFIIFTVFITGLVFSPSIVFAADTAPTTFQPEIAIPGLENLPNDSSLMARYTRAIFVFFIWIVGLLAVVMIIYGGIRWVAAAGNSSQIKEARDIVTNAIAGVALALLSVVILRTINPDLAELKKITLGTTAGYNLQYANEKNPDGTCKTSAELPCGLTCTDKNGTVYGRCVYCDSTQVTDKKSFCGESPGDPIQLSTEKNCIFTTCTKTNQVCEKVQNNLTQAHLCSSEARLPSFTTYGYGALGVSYSDKYTCGEIWWEQSTFLSLDPEEINVGRKCSKSKHCVVDYTQNISITTGRNSIPNGENAYKIGSFKDSGCH